MATAKYTNPHSTIISNEAAVTYEGGEFYAVARDGSRERKNITTRINSLGLATQMIYKGIDVATEIPDYDVHVASNRSRR